MRTQSRNRPCAAKPTLTTSEQGASTPNAWRLKSRADHVAKAQSTLRDTQTRATCNTKHTHNPAELTAREHLRNQPTRSDHRSAPLRPTTPLAHDARARAHLDAGPATCLSKCSEVNHPAPPRGPASEHQHPLLESSADSLSAPHARATAAQRGRPQECPSLPKATASTRTFAALV